MKLKFRPSFCRVSDTFRAQVSAKFRSSFGQISENLLFRPSFGQVSNTFRMSLFLPSFGQVLANLGDFCFGYVSDLFRIRFGASVSAKFRSRHLFRPSFGQVSNTFRISLFRPSFSQVSAKFQPNLGNVCFGQVSTQSSVSGKFRPSFGQVSSKFPGSTKFISFRLIRISTD